MNSAKPYLGCKIALISMAQNRYVGMLYTIDKVNSTVVLAKVKCYGTEDRPADRPTPPRNDVYEYITFRGSDIKDISLWEAPPSQHGLAPDPAILLVSVQVPVYHQFPSQSLHNEDYATALGIGKSAQISFKQTNYVLLCTVFLVSELEYLSFVSICERPDTIF
uniref:Lsm14-like N-terminal domain-containing protein n=1 Tax=Neogobius melanostomus TaxID=47308 RepID=A0A8C6UT09_9GOBI